MAELCLTLLCPPSVEEKLLDMLLITPVVSLFCSTSGAAHGTSTAPMSATEQVLGRAFVTQVQVLFASADKEALLWGLQQQFSGAGLRYWITPVLERGEFSASFESDKDKK